MYINSYTVWGRNVVYAEEMLYVSLPLVICVSLQMSYVNETETAIEMSYS